jgi:hypothetical protein
VRERHADNVLWFSREAMSAFLLAARTAVEAVAAEEDQGELSHASARSSQLAEGATNKDIAAKLF